MNHGYFPNTTTIRVRPASSGHVSVRRTVNFIVITTLVILTIAIIADKLCELTASLMNESEERYHTVNLGNNTLLTLDVRGARIVQDFENSIRLNNSEIAIIMSDYVEERYPQIGIKNYGNNLRIEFSRIGNHQLIKLSRGKTSIRFDGGQFVNFLIALRHKSVLPLNLVVANQTKFPRYHLGQSIFISICRDEDRRTIVDLRHFNNSLPGSRGVQLNVDQTKELLSEKCVELNRGTSNSSSNYLLKGQVQKICCYINGEFVALEVNKLVAKRKSGKFIVLNKVQANVLYKLKTTILKDIDDVNSNVKRFCKSE
jgi:hypothetical protein